MSSKKTTILILSIIFIIVVFGTAIFYISQIHQENQRQIQAKKQKQELTQKETKKNSPEKDNDNNNEPDYSGTVTKEENGWKRYTNPYWGIEFRFRDEGDKMKIQSDRDGIFVSDGDDITYIDIYSEKFDNLYRYLQKNQNWSECFPDAPELKLISMEKLTNKNQVEYIKVTARARSVRNRDVYYTIEEYFLNYNNPKHKDKNFIVIHGTEGEVFNQIINSFKFIDNQ